MGIFALHIHVTCAGVHRNDRVTDFAKIDSRQVCAHVPLYRGDLLCLGMASFLPKIGSNWHSQQR